MFFFCCCLVIASMSLQRPPRTKRGLLELAGVIKCSTGRSALAYMMYGCYCGLGGQGWPRDKADWCCHKHDCCYGDAELLVATPRQESINGHVKTGLQNVMISRTNVRRFSANAAKCLRKAPFIRKYAMWPDFLCGCTLPTCNIY
ncbi:unnamed protein product [Oncorhynchus mykiss]|uniref:Phospholipase A2 n=1 Tax=Oncorhynchus mykiss TaxID=8022 RepID=A0A060WAM9_ONCMY|nr:unnamed protein product [Oncorhynchus mykiss]